MVQTRGVGIAAPQTSFWVVAMILLSIGIEMLMNAGGDFRREVLGVVVVLAGVVVILLKYYLKLPDISMEEAVAAIEDLEKAYEAFLTYVKQVYDDVHDARDEIVAHRQLIEAVAGFLPPVYQAKLKDVLDALENNLGV